LHDFKGSITPLCRNNLRQAANHSEKNGKKVELEVILSRKISAGDLFSMYSMKRLSSYLLGAGLALSVAVFAAPAIAQDSGNNGSTAGSTSPSMAPNNAASPGNGGVTDDSGASSPSAKSPNPDAAANPDTANNGAGSTTPASTAATDSDSGSTAQ
jgi:hypothetical protein